MGKQTKSGASAGRKASSKREPAASAYAPQPAGDVAVDVEGSSMSHQDLIHRLKRKQEVFSKLGGLVSTLQRQENVGQWKSKLEELEEIRAERDQLRLEAEEKDAMVSELTKTNDELNGAVGTLHDDLKRLNDRFMQEKEVAQQLNDHISRMQADLQSGSESKVQAAVWEQKYLDCRAELEGSKVCDDPNIRAYSGITASHHTRTLFSPGHCI
jgi:chromosome segregation ATPase